jgi:ParB-like chromosome segregation protein Spo0J
VRVSGVGAYPADRAGRQQLANELTASGLKPTQGKQHFDPDKIDKMADAMKDGSFDWNKASLQPVILGPSDEVMGGHHRVVAAHLAGIDLSAVPGPRPQIQRLPNNLRPVSDWIDVLPEAP